MLSQFFFLNFIFVLSYGRTNDRVCNYSFIGLDDNITLTSNASLSDVAAVIRLHDMVSDTEAQNKYFYMIQAWQYFALEGNYLMVRNCLPAGLTEALTFVIEGEDWCDPGHLTIHVEPTIPVFHSKYGRVNKRKVDIDTCMVGNTTKVFRISIENEGDCFGADCRLECITCHDKDFWLTEDNKIETSSYDIQFGNWYQLQIYCFDSTLHNVSRHHQVNIALAVQFIRKDTCSTEQPQFATINTSSINPTTSEQSKATVMVSGLWTTTATTLTDAMKSTAVKSTATTLSTTISTKSATQSVLMTVTTVFASTPSTLTTTPSQANLYHVKTGFFDKRMNIATLSIIGGLIFVCAMVSVIHAAWNQCCRVSSTSFGSAELNKEVLQQENYLGSPGKGHA